MQRVPNPTAGAERDSILPGGFARYERDITRRPVTVYAGLGYVQRFPDYWELVSAGKESIDSLSAFDTRPEKTTQFDTGLVSPASACPPPHRRSTATSMTTFSSRPGTQGHAPRDGDAQRPTARTWGGEADATWALTQRWQLMGTLAWTRGENSTDDLPLAQMPPLELRTGLNYAGARLSGGLLWRVVAEQDRYALNQGNVVGQDLGRTGGFGVLSLNGAGGRHAACWYPPESTTCSTRSMRSTSAAAGRWCRATSRLRASTSPDGRSGSRPPRISTDGGETARLGITYRAMPRPRAREYST